LVQVKFEFVEYESPTKGDHFILVERRFLFRWVDDVRVGDRLLISGILCDACNTPIYSDYVPILILCRPMRPWGAMCRDCVKSYHKRLHDRIWKLKAGELEKISVEEL